MMVRMEIEFGPWLLLLFVWFSLINRCVFELLSVCKGKKRGRFRLFLNIKTERDSILMISDVILPICVNGAFLP